jgi:hypothetical protein
MPGGHPYRHLTAARQVAWGVIGEEFIAMEEKTALRLASFDDSVSAALRRRDWRNVGPAN